MASAGVVGVFLLLAAPAAFGAVPLVVVGALEALIVELSGVLASILVAYIASYAVSFLHRCLKK